jgi:DNA-directed RNA polymerase specialized sigma24 family protein
VERCGGLRKQERSVLLRPQPEEFLRRILIARDRFAKLEPQQAELVKLRYLVGLRMEEAAEVLVVSKSTAKRGWAYARAWLFNEMQMDSSPIAPRDKL